jgi:hypothetical protein
MAISELIFPTYVQDKEALAKLSQRAPEIFKYFQGVDGLKSLYRGKIIEDNGAAVGADSGRSVLALEWEKLSSFHAFYPSSPAFQGFVATIKPFLAGPAQPELFEEDPAWTHCLASEATQIVQGTRGEDAKSQWNELKASISKSDVQTPAFFYANGVENQQQQFLGLIGWKSQADYERSIKDDTVLSQIRKITAGKNGKNMVAKFTRAS